MSKYLIFGKNGWIGGKLTALLKGERSLCLFFDIWLLVEAKKTRIICGFIIHQLTQINLLTQK